MRIVIDPKFCFDRLDARLASMGWHRKPDPAAPPPIISGEPDMATWKRPETDVCIVYTFHPAMYLRVLLFEGENAERCHEELAQHLPVLTVSDIRRLIRSSEIESMLLGIHAANAMNAFEVIDQVAGLMEHSDELVAKEARKVFHKLLDSAAALGLGILAEWKTQHPDRSALFLIAGGPRERRQLLRWLMYDQKRSNTHIDAVLRTALEDEDWEVRVTAMLVVARLKATAVVNKVYQVKLPDTLEQGLNAVERRMLMACRRAALGLLEGQTTPPQTEAPPDTREAMQAHIMRCIVGLPVSWHDKVFLLIYSLITPLPANPPVPKNLPAGLSKSMHGYRLQWNNIALCWIPPVTHWLGEDLPRMNIVNPIRQYQPQRGFFISERNFTPPDFEDKFRPYMCSYQEAIRWCEKISTEVGLKVRLPTADEWESAARGSDGRRFPWGNNAQEKNSYSTSPWGIEDAVGVIAQWTSTIADSNGPIVSGGPKQLVCAMRETTRPNTNKIGFRFVVEV